MRTAIVIVVCLFYSGATAAAQQRVEAGQPKRLIISEKAIANGLTIEQPAPRDQKDSLLNGTFIGAVVGAAVMGVGVTYLCNALKEPGDPPCWKSSGLAIAIGAGAGALGGAGIDALLTTTPRYSRRAEVTTFNSGR